MKGMDFFCASPASTAICSSMDHRSAVVHHGSSRHNPHRYLHDRRRLIRPPLPCSSQLPPINPKPYNHQNSRKSSAKETDITMKRKSSADIIDLTSPHGSSRYLLSDAPFFDLLSDSEPVSAQPARLRKQLSSNDSQPLKSSSSSSTSSYRSRSLQQQLSLNGSQPLKSSSSSYRSRSLQQQRSSNDSPVLKSSSPSYHSRSLQQLSLNDSPALTSSSSNHSHDQVVVLRVSIHCKGCEGKVRKHISRMEGVTSFSIDLATKKVTVIGDVTPLGVLASVSKIKSAQLWPSQTSLSSSSSPSMSIVNYST